MSFDSQTIRICSLSGGGTKGYGENHFLKEAIAQSGMSWAEFVDSVDVWGGVSTGAILSCAYMFGLSTTEVADFYEQQSPWIFTIRSASDVLIGSHDASYPSNRPNAVQKGIMLAENDGFYQSAYEDSNYGHVRLQSELVNVFGNYTLADLSKNLLIPAVQYDIQKPVMFSNYHDSKYFISNNNKITDVIRCTSAAFPYLPKYEYRDNLYTDGAFYANNVVKEAVNLGLTLKPHARRIVILDVGAGVGALNFDDDDPEQDGGIATLFNYINLQLQCNEKNAENYMGYRNDRIFKINGLPLYYYKWQPVFPNTFSNEIDNSTQEWFAELLTHVNAHFVDQSDQIADIMSRWVL